MSPPSTPKCPNCGGTEIDVDHARGDAACVDCGTVLQDAVIVAEVGFQEDARGRSSAIGQHVNAEGRPNRYSGALAGFSREATQITLDKGKQRIRDLASSLKMVQRAAEAASRLFNVAVERNFHKGRRMANVCCACLYVVCRRDKTPHMLIDFADVLETNVYVLGHTFLKLAQLLSIGLPIIDPSLYIHRFASNLEFGDKTHAVAMTALRLLARMRREWMSYGRRPAGLCGAALMTAAKIHNFHRSMADVVRVVRIGNVALRERLQELHQTPTAELTVAQIEAGGGDDGKEDTLSAFISADACFPPAFRNAQKRQMVQEEARRRLAALNAAAAPAPAAAAAGAAPAAGRAGARGGKAGSKAGSGEAARSAAAAASAAAALATKPRPLSAEDAELEREVQSALASEELKQLDYEALVDEQQTLARARRRRAGPAGDGGGSGSGGDGGGTDAAAAAAAGEPAGERSDGVELSDLDEEDVAQYLNTEEEYEQKKEIWQEVNREYLEQQALLEKMKAERPEEYRKLRPSRSAKKRKAGAAGAAGAHGRAADPAAKHARGAAAHAPGADQPPPKPSSKLNYDAIKSLGGPGGFGAALRARPAAAAARPPLPPAATAAAAPPAAPRASLPVVLE